MANSPLTKAKSKMKKIKLTEGWNSCVKNVFLFEDLRTFNPLISPRFTVATLSFVMMICFILLGLLVVVAKEPVVQKIRYDNEEKCKIDLVNPTYGNVCEVTIQIKQRMNLPVFVYYELTKVYQNHYEYKTSVSYDQLAGKNKSRYKACSGAEKFSGKIIYPCGINPTSAFSDKIVASLKTSKMVDHHLVPNFDIANADSDTPSWKKSGIAWELDKQNVKDMDTTTKAFKEKFIRYGPEQNRIRENTKDNLYVLPLPSDEDLLVWIRTSAWSNFRKLYRKILRFNSNLGRQHLEKGDTLTFKIRNYYRVNSKVQSKSIVVATQTFLGGDKRKLIVMLFFLFVVCLVILIAIFFNYLFCPRKFGDITFMS